MIMGACSGKAGVSPAGREALARAQHDSGSSTPAVRPTARAFAPAAMTTFGAAMSPLRRLHAGDAPAFNADADFGHAEQDLRRARALGVAVDQRVGVEPPGDGIIFGGDDARAHPAEAVAHFVGVQIFDVRQADLVQTVHIGLQPAACASLKAQNR